MKYINLTSHYEYVLCAAKQPLGAVDSAERDDGCRREWGVMWKWWTVTEGQRDREITVRTSENKKHETWKKTGSSALRLWTWLEACTLTEGQERNDYWLELREYSVWNCSAVNVWVWARVPASVFLQVCFTALLTSRLHCVGWNNDWWISETKQLWPNEALPGICLHPEKSVAIASIHRWRGSKWKIHRCWNVLEFR
jgi:hypothetical protein